MHKDKLITYNLCAKSQIGWLGKQSCVWKKKGHPNQPKY